jgi:hypothetical protein
MGPGEHRPYDEQYCTRPWLTALFAGDLLEGVAFGEQPTVLYTPEDLPPRHFLGEVAFGYGLLITPTCEMTEQREGGMRRSRRPSGGARRRRGSSMRPPVDPKAIRALAARSAARRLYRYPAIDPGSFRARVERTLG